MFPLPPPSFLGHFPPGGRQRFLTQDIKASVIKGCPFPSALHAIFALNQVSTCEGICVLRLLNYISLFGYPLPVYCTALITVAYNKYSYVKEQVLPLVLFPRDSVLNTKQGEDSVHGRVSGTTWDRVSELRRSEEGVHIAQNRESEPKQGVEGVRARRQCGAK